MITANIVAYLRLEQLPELKMITRKGVAEPRKQPRYDLTAYAGYWQGLEKLKNHQGKVFFNLIPSDKNKQRKVGATVPEYYLQCTPARSKAINFTGVRFMYDRGEVTSVASGEPSGKERLTGGVINPTYAQRNDGFLFLFSEGGDVLEVLVIDSGRTLIDAYRTQLYRGGFNAVLSTLRAQAKEV